MPRLFPLILLAIAIPGLARAQTSLAPPAPPARPSIPAAISVQDITRLEGQGRSILKGMGIVVGLRGTGDSAQDLNVARPLAEVYASLGNPIADLKELGRGKAAALVWVECEVPESGALADDRLDVSVSAIHGASSLAGGRLILAPLSGPLPGQGVYALASGPVIIEDSERPTAGRVRQGASIVNPITMGEVDDEFTLIVRPRFRSWSTTRTIAGEINGALGAAEDGLTIAQALDDIRVRVVVPDTERSDPAGFIARVLSTRMSPTLLDLPAMVVINERAKSFVITGDVEISPIVTTIAGLTITTTTPAPLPTPADPLITRSNLVPISTGGRGIERARLADLIEALNQLDIPVQDQITVLTEIHKSGRLHADLVVE